MAYPAQITRRLFLGTAPAAAVVIPPSCVPAEAAFPSLTAAIRNWQKECRIAEELQAIVRAHKGDTPERDKAHLNWKVQYEVRQDALTALLEECARFTSA